MTRISRILNYLVHKHEGGKINYRLAKYIQRRGINRVIIVRKTINHKIGMNIMNIR